MNNIAPVQAGQFTVHVRTEKTGDNDVIGEVLTGNCYKLDQLKAEGVEPKTIVDLGAHIGTFSMLAHSLWPNAKIVCIEPNKRSFELLKLNCPFAECVNAALFYGQKPILTDDKFNATGGGFVCEKEHWDKIAAGTEQVDTFIHRIFDEDVKTLTLEDVIELYCPEGIDLFKWDCEGGEFQVLEHAEAYALASIRRVVGEYHTEKGFNFFKELAESKLPWLEFYGGNGGPIGPFFTRSK